MKKTYVLLGIFLSLCSFVDPESAQRDSHIENGLNFIPELERYALIQLYSSTGGDTWMRKDNWKLRDGEYGLPGTESSWYGIEVRKGHVVAINLASNSLSGSLPAAIEYFTRLERLNLENNQITGEIPFEIGRLSNLRSLALYSNRFNGAIPNELADLTNLERIYLFDNNLEIEFRPERVAQFLNKKSGVRKNDRSRGGNHLGLYLLYDEEIGGLDIKIFTQEILCPGAKNLLRLEVTSLFSVGRELADSMISAALIARDQYGQKFDIYRNEQFYRIGNDDIGTTIDLCFEDYLSLAHSESGYLELYPEVKVMNGSIPAVVHFPSAATKGHLIPQHRHDDCDPNEVFEKAIQLDHSKYIEGLFHVCTDPDWFTFAAEDDETAIEIGYDHRAANLGLFLYDSIGTEIATSDDYQVNMQRIEQELRPGEKYYIKIISLNIAESAFYSIKINSCPSITIRKEPSGRQRILTPVSLHWGLASSYPLVECRYRLAVPPGFPENNPFDPNRWSAWSNSRDVFYDQLTTEGKYSFIVECRNSRTKQPVGKKKKSWKMYWEYPEVLAGELYVDWDKAFGQPNEREKYQTLADEFKKEYERWMLNYKREHEKLDLILTPKKIVAAMSACLTNGVGAVLQEWVEMSAKPTAENFLGRLILPSGIYKIIQWGILDLIPIYRSAGANAALSMAVSCHCAWKHYQAMASEEESFKLVVIKAEGVLGTPKEQTTIKQKASRVKYKFHLAQGYIRLKVKLNGKAVPPLGSFIMGEDQVLHCTAERGAVPKIQSFKINGGMPTTIDRKVSLHIRCTGEPTHFMASEREDFRDAAWIKYSTSPRFVLSAGAGEKIVFVIVKNSWGVSQVKRDSIVIKKSAPSDVPVLFFPKIGAVLDNGRTDGNDSIIWDFDWSDVQGATQYHLYVIGSNATYPVISTFVAGKSWFQSNRPGSYIIEYHRYNWRWMVRAYVDGKWSNWSSEWSFDVEPVNTDPPNGNN